METRLYVHVGLVIRTITVASPGLGGGDRMSAVGARFLGGGSGSCSRDVITEKVYLIGQLILYYQDNYLSHEQLIKAFKIFRHSKCYSGFVKSMKSPHKDYIHDPMVISVI